jgi:hypothetical protein
VSLADTWSRPITLGIVGGALMFALGIRKEAHAQRLPPTGSATALHVPRATVPPKIDGELDDVDWTRMPGRTGAFVGEDGTPARPFSEARVTWDETNLYVALYAADEDIRVAKVPADGPLWTGDAFGLTITRSDGWTGTIDVGPSGAITDGANARGVATDFSWQSRAVVATDIDGTLDDPSDRDEEWVVEMAIPFSSLGITPRHGERIGFSAKRCDRLAGKKRVCGSWGKPGVLILD